MQRFVSTSRPALNCWMSIEEKHQAVWPEMHAMRYAKRAGRIIRCSLRDDGLLIGYLETEDFEEAKTRHGAARSQYARWQREMARFLSDTRRDVSPDTCYEAARRSVSSRFEVYELPNPALGRFVSLAGRPCLRQLLCSVPRREEAGRGKRIGWSAAFSVGLLRPGFWRPFDAAICFGVPSAAHARARCSGAYFFGLSVGTSAASLSA